MSSFETLVEVFTEKGDSTQTITFIEGKDVENIISFAQLRNHALKLLGKFQALGMTPGDELIIFLNNNQRFIEVFWACILGGIVPVPVAVGIRDEHKSKLFKIFSRLKRGYIYLNSESLQRLDDYAQSVSSDFEYSSLKNQAIIHDEIEIEDLPADGNIAEITADDVAFIQFSSGSTSDPKGVVLSHRNVVANVKSIAAGSNYTAKDCSFGWMPLTHDMGLIGFHINMLVWDIRQCIMTTDLFSRRPLLWLQKASEHKATLLCSPNFGYKHYLKALGDKEVELDLSSVRLIYNGAEPISVDTCEQFLHKMKQYGLKRNAMFTVYGLAEASLAVAFPKLDCPYEVLHVTRNDLQIGESVEIVDNANSSTLSFVIEGPPVRDVEIKITNMDNLQLGEKCIGEIQIKGPNVTRGYYDNDEANTLALTGDGWLNTGDLGFIYNGSLVVTGRTKDIIFANGQNYFPHDLENILIQHCQLELGKVVVSSYTPLENQQDQLLVFLLSRGDSETFAAVAAEIARIINVETGLTVDAVVAVKRIPKTTSGKIQRRLLVNDYLSDEDNARVFTPAQNQQAEANDADADESLTDLERQLVEICNSTLEAQTLAADENFFDAGISSLALSEIHAKIDDVYPGLLDIVDFFEHQTVKEVAALIVLKQQKG